MDHDKPRRNRSRKRTFDEGHRKRRRETFHARPAFKSKKDLPKASGACSTSSSFRLTPKAVEAMVTGAPFPGRDMRQEEEPNLVVRLDFSEGNSTYEEELMVATMSDGSQFTKVLVRKSLENPYLFRKSCIVSVHGYVTSGNSPDSKYDIPAFICLTSVRLLTTIESSNGLTLSSGDRGGSLGTPFEFHKQSPSKKQLSSKRKQQSPTRVHGGNIGVFLSERLPFLTNEEITGSYYLSSSLYDRTNERSRAEQGENKTDHPAATHDDNVHKVGNFLAQHSAMMTLQTAAEAAVVTEEKDPELSGTAGAMSSDAVEAATTAVPTSPTGHAVENYNAALKEFSVSQLDRQKASLVTNAGREAAERSSLVMDRYNAALEQALRDHASPLSPALLTFWHATLLQGLHPEAGTIRNRPVRAGNTIFTPPDRIRRELELLCTSLESLEARLSNSNHSSSNTDSGNSNNSKNVVNTIVFAAIAMFGVVDIHPFADGNGRLSRIVANWALKRFSNLPFPINLFATPSQRSDYVLALEMTLHNMSLHARGAVSRDEIVEATKYTGVFLPLVRLLMERLARAVSECTRVWEEKSGLAAEAAEARAARRARERAAEGTCIICLDERPNIATLCCGKAVHLNCIAEWLGARNSCPVCRSELPSINGRVVRAAAPRRQQQEEDTTFLLDVFLDEDGLALDGNRDDDGDQDDEEDEDYTSFDDTTSASFEDERAGATEDATEDTTEEATEDTTVDEEVDTAETEEQSPAPSSDNDVTTSEDVEDTTIQTQDEGDATTSNEDETTGDDDDETTQPLVAPTPRLCQSSFCRNRPAVDCTNGLCGRCCVLNGEYHCPRHNS